MFKASLRTTRIQPGNVLSVARRALHLVQQGLSIYKKARVEGCCFWYGPEADSNEMLITHVVFPKQINRPLHFTVTAEAIAEMSEETRTLHVFNRAQLHTHPAAWVGHSGYDDDHAISRKILSIVIPHYGAAIRDWPKGIGAHEFRDGKWQSLGASQIVQRVRLIKSEINLIDLR